MAISKGTEQKVFTVKNYVGVGVVKPILINPKQKDLEKIGINVKEEPVYISTKVDETTKKETKQVRVDVWFKILTEFNNITEEDTKKISFYIDNSFSTNKDETKVKVINPYGETTWLSIEDAKNKVIPESLSWYDGTNFRPCFKGEEELTKFIKDYLGIPNKSFKNNKTGVVMEIPDKTQAHCRLEIDKLFKGDFSEIIPITSYRPDNKVKLFFGIKKTDDNKTYQSFLPYSARVSITDYSKFKSDYENSLSFGRYANQTYSFEGLKEYVEEVKPTTFTPNIEPSESSNPWFNQSVDDLPY